MLRHFSCLDRNALDQYLGQLEGSLIEHLGKRTLGKRGGSLGGGYAGASARLAASEEVEITENREVPPSARFQTLYGPSGDISESALFVKGDTLGAPPAESFVAASWPVSRSHLFAV